MARLFRRAPEAIDRTLRFLDRCNFSLEELNNTEYPDENRVGFARRKSARGARRRMDIGSVIRKAPGQAFARRSIRS